MIQTAIRPQKYSQHEFPHINGYECYDVSIISRRILNGAQLCSLSPEAILNVSDHEGNIASNLHIFMEFIKVFPFKGHVNYDNSPNEFWRKWKINGFKQKYKIFNGCHHAFSYDGTKLNPAEEAEYFENIYTSHIKTNPAFLELKKLHLSGVNLLLIDFDKRVPELLKKMLIELD